MHRAKFTTHRASSRRLHAAESITGVVQSDPWRRGIDHGGQFGLVYLFELLVLKIVNDMFPGIFRLTDHHRIHILNGLFGQHGGMDPSDNSLHTIFPVHGSNLVTSVDRGCQGCKSHKVGLFILKRFEILIVDLYVPVRRCEGGNDPQRQGRINPILGAHKPFPALVYRVDQQ